MRHGAEEAFTLQVRFKCSSSSYVTCPAVESSPQGVGVKQWHFDALDPKFLKHLENKKRLHVRRLLLPIKSKNETKIIMLIMQEVE